MAIKLSKAETATVVSALRFHADHMAGTMEEALRELGGEEKARKMPAVLAAIMSQKNGANDLRTLAQKIEEYGPGAKPGQNAGLKPGKPKAAAAPAAAAAAG